MCIYELYLSAVSYNNAFLQIFNHFPEGWAIILRILIYLLCNLIFSRVEIIIIKLVINQLKNDTSYHRENKFLSDGKQKVWIYMIEISQSFSHAKVQNGNIKEYDFLHDSLVLAKSLIIHI